MKNTFILRAATFQGNALKMVYLFENCSFLFLIETIGLIMCLNLVFHNSYGTYYPP